MCSRRTCVFVGVACVLLLTVKLLHGLERTFISRCELHSGFDCQKLWSLLQQAYVGKDPCKVPWEAYDPLIAAFPFKPACNRMMFWSQTKNLVQAFAEKHKCFITLEKTVLGSILDGLTWCGKEGSRETSTSGCPNWNKCEDNPVRSFWGRASAAFADVACDDVTAMLSGSIETPFSLQSTFGRIEVRRLTCTRVKSLTIILVSKGNAVSNCRNASFKDLQRALDGGIKYSCTEVTESQLNGCSSDPCDRCW